MRHYRFLVVPYWHLLALASLIVLSTIFLLSSEVRTHGVGFYQFNKDEAARQEQLDALKELRQQVRALKTC